MYYALRFLFVNIYHKEWAKEYLPTPKVAKTLPLVLSKDEVADVLAAIDNFKHRAIIMLIYSTGARVSESVNIKLTDIDSKRMQVNIQEGKGLKQRKVPLSPVLLSVLRAYYKKYKPQYYLFEGAGGKGTHLGADIGLVTVLHTWGQNMKEHPHLHCIMPAGGLSFDREHWVHVPDKNNFFIAGKILAKKFRGKFLDMLKQARGKGGLGFHGKLTGIKGPVQFNRFLTPLYKKDWVVNVQKPMGNPEKILESIRNFRQPNCPACKKGRLRFAGVEKDIPWEPG